MSEDIYAINYDYAKQLKEAHKQMYNNPDKVEHRYKKAWEEFRGIIEEQGKHSFQWILTLMDLTIPPPRVYDPDKEWVPVSSGQMPTHSNEILCQDKLGVQWVATNTPHPWHMGWFAMYRRRRLAPSCIIKL